MIAADTASEARPYLPSAIALVGLAIILSITAYMGIEYWAVRRADAEMAWINAGCELIAFGGLAAAAYGWPKRWPWIVTGSLIAVAMSAACGFTAYQRLADDEYTRSSDAVRQSPEYRDAQGALEAARQAAGAWERDDPRPRCACPDTIAAWGRTHGAEAERRERVAERRLSALTAMMPPRRVSPAALVRSAALELVKLLGFGAFGGVWFYAWRNTRSKVVLQRASLEGEACPALSSSHTVKPARMARRSQRSASVGDMAADIPGWEPPLPLGAEV